MVEVDIEEIPAQADFRWETMFVSRYMPCPSCGASLERGLSEEHVCEHERWLDFQMFQLRAEVEAFDGQLSAFLQSPHGRFEVWYALRERRRAA